MGLTRAMFRGGWLPQVGAITSGDGAKLYQRPWQQPTISQITTRGALVLITSSRWAEAAAASNVPLLAGPRGFATDCLGLPGW